MIDLANISVNSKILEPSCGEGVFIKLLNKKGSSNIIAYEIDKKLSKNNSQIRYESFVSANISEKFDLIIGNPHYIRWKNLETELKEKLSTNSL